MVSAIPQIVDKPLVCGRGFPGRLSTHRSSIQHGRPTPSHRPALTFARCSALADFASLRVLGAPAASRPPTLTSSLVALPASLGSSYRPALRWPGIPGLRSASRCPRPATPSGLRRPVSRTARGLRAPRLRRPSVPALRTVLAFGGAVFRRCGRLLGVSSRLQPLCGLQRPATGTGMHFYASHRPALRLHGVPCLRTALAFGGSVFRPCGLRFAPCPRGSSCFAAFDCALRVLGTLTLRAFAFSQAFASTVCNRRSASLAGSLAVLVAHWAFYALFRPQGARFVRPTKNARNDVHAVISDLSLVLPILCQGSDCGPSQTRRPTMLYSNSKIAAKNKLPPRLHRSFSSIF